MREWLSKRRTDLGFTQADVAAKLNISNAYYSLIEQGKRQNPMSMKMAWMLSNVLHISVKDIMKNEGY